MSVHIRRKIADYPQGIAAVEELDIADLAIPNVPVDVPVAGFQGPDLVLDLVGQLVRAAGEDDFALIYEDDGLSNEFHVRYDVGCYDDRSIRR